VSAEVGIKIGVQGASQATQQLAGVDAALTKLGSASDTARNALAAIGVGVSVAGFANWIKSAVDAADAMNDISERTGLAVKEIAGLQLAFQMGDVDAAALTGTMSKLSRSVVDNAGAFSAIGVATKEADGSFRSTRQILGDVADKFASYEDGIEKAALAQELFGKSGADLIPVLNMGAEGLAEMDEMAARLGLTLDQETAEQAGRFNDTLDLIGAGARGIATRIAADLLPTLSGLAEQFFNSATSGDTLKRVAEGLGLALKALYVTGRAVVEAFSAVGKTLGASGAVIANVLSGDFAAAGRIAAELKGDLQAGFADALGDIERAWKATGSAAVESLAVAQRGARATAPVIKSVGQAAKETADEFAAQRDAAKDWAKAWGDFNKIGRDAAASADELTKGQARLVEYLQSPAYTQASDAMRELALQEAYAAISAEQAAAAQKAAAKAVEDRVKAAEGAADSAEKALADLERENEAAAIAAERNISLAQAIETVNLARLQEQRAILAADPARAAELAAIDREIAARRALYDAIGSRDAREAATKSADDAAKEWAKSADNIERSLTDALMRGFESGKGFIQNLKDTAVNAFKTMVLQPTVKAIVGGVAGSLGFSSPASAAGSAINGAAGIGNLGSLLGLGSAATMFSAGTGIASSVIAANGFFGGAGAVLGYAAEAAAAGELALAIGTAAPYLLPAAAAIMALVSILGKGGGPKAGGEAVFALTGGTATLSTQRALYTPSTADADLQGTVAGVVESIKRAATSLGGAIGDFTVGLGYDTDPRGETSSRISSFLSTALGDVLRNINLDMGRDADALQAGLATEVQRLILAGLQTATLPTQIEQIFDSLDAATATQQQIDEVFQAATAMRGLLTVAESLGLPMERVSETLIGAAGGVGSLTEKLSGYYADFYTEAEKTARATATLKDQFADLGVALPGTREGFRALVDGIIETLATGPANAALESQLGGLLTLKDAFLAVTPATEAAAEAVDTVTESASRLTETLSTAGLADLYETVGLDSYAASLRKFDTQLKLVTAGFSAEIPKTLEDLQRLVLSASPEQAAWLATFADDLVSFVDVVEEGAGTVGAAAVTLDEALQALRTPIRTVEQIAQSLFALESQGSQLNVDLLRAQGRTTEADAAQLAIDTAGMTDAEKALFNYNAGLRDQIAALQAASAAEAEAARAAQERERAVQSQRQSLERQLLEVQGDSAAIRALERSAIDESNLALYDQIITLQDAAAAAAKVADEERALAADRERISSQRSGLERRELELLGDTAALRALDRAEIDASNLALYDRIIALQDSAAASAKAAEEERTLAAERDRIASQRAGLERRELELLGDTAALRALDRAAIDESNLAIYDRIVALQDSAAAAAAATETERALQAERDRVAAQRASLERELLELQGDTAALRALERAEIDASNIELYDQVVALRDLRDKTGDAVDSTETLADALARLRNPMRSVEDVARGILALEADAARLAVDLLDAQGRVDEAAAARRNLDTAGRTQAEIALYDANAATQAQIDELRRSSQAAAADAAERVRLETRLLELQGDTDALRARALEGLSAENAEIQRKIWLIEDQAAAEAVAQAQRDEAARAAEQAAAEASAAQQAREAEAQRIAGQRAGLERQLLELQGDAAALRALERAEIDAANRDLFDRIAALRDEQAAAAAAAQEAERITSQRSGLERQLLELQGDQAALRALERSEIDAANLVIYDRIVALRDEQAAAAIAARIADERVGLERQLLQAIGDTDALRAAELAALDPSNRELQLRIWALQDETQAASEAAAAADRLAQAWTSATDSIRAEVDRLRGSAGGEDFAVLQSQFAISTAAARAGDLTAAESLAELSRRLEQAGTAQAGSALEVVQLQARLAASLEETARLIDPTTFTAPLDEPDTAEAVTAELVALRDDQRAQSASMAALMLRMSKMLERWDQDGLPEERVVA
jgi:hypothetical protein